MVMLLEKTPRPSNGMSISSRTLLCAPSAPIRYWPVKTLPTTLDVFGEDGDGFVILLDLDDLEPIRDLCASSFGALPKDWLETRLSDEYGGKGSTRRRPR